MRAWCWLPVILPLVACGPSQAGKGSETDQVPASTGAGPIPTSSSASNTGGADSTGGVGSTGGPDSNGSSEGEGPSTGTSGEPERPPGLDTWGLSLVWTGIIGDVFAIDDFEADGHVDVSAQVHGDGHQWILTTHRGRGDGSFDGLAPTQAEWTSRPWLGDFDGDGWVDQLGVVFSIGPRVLRHQGDGRFTLMSVAELPEDQGMIGAVLDIDGDGLDDLMLGAWTHSTLGTMAINQGGDTFAGIPELPHPACYFAEMRPVDRDGDGDEDLFSAGGCNSGSPQASWYGYYDNDGTTLALGQAFPADPTPYEGTWPRPVDFDDDGLDDLAIAARTWSEQEGLISTGLLVFTNEGGVNYQVEYFEQEWTTSKPQVFGLRLPGDDRGVVVVDQGEYDSLLLLRAGEGDVLEVHGVWLGGEALDVADFDEDGRPDLVVTRAHRDQHELGLWLSGGR